MEHQRKMSPSPGKHPGSQEPTGSTTQGLPTLIVMIAVLTIIILFCCFAAPGVRDLCKRYVLRSCVIDDPDVDNANSAADSATPTIILLPYGRMLVVDRSVFAQLQADNTGIDFMELSANLIRAQRFQTGSTPSFLDSEATSKGLSPTSLGFSPPAYEEIFGDCKNSDLPPSYSEVSLLFRVHNHRPVGHHNRRSREDIELCHINADTRCGVDSDNENYLNKELVEGGAPGDNNNCVQIDLDHSADASTSNIRKCPSESSY